MCVVAREQSPSLMCTPEGDFEPLQCVPEGPNGLMSCDCVHPSNGTVLPGTATVVSDRADAPDCNALG